MRGFWNQLALDICEAVGIDGRMTQLVRLDLHHDDFPRLYIERIVVDEGEVRNIRRVFEQYQLSGEKVGWKSEDVKPDKRGLVETTGIQNEVRTYERAEGG